MAQTKEKKRFQVALSFPGEYRGRVEKIGELLGARLGRDRILYDKWYDYEFAKPGLGISLPKLYHDESDLIVLFFCKEYQQKEWCGLELRAVHDLIKKQQYDCVMLMRLDDIDIADIEGFYSGDGCLDIRRMSESQVAERILNRLGAVGQVRDLSPRLTNTRRLPVVDPHVFGRAAEIEWLDRAWQDPHTNFVQIIGDGGAGKTALMTHWFRRHLEDTSVVGWSFYSQGARERCETSPEPFFSEALAWFGLTVEQNATIYAKVDSLLDRLRRERVLLILDGVEPMQEPSGEVRDPALRALMQELAARNAGMLLVTSRFRLIDIPEDEPRALSFDLENLDSSDGAHYLGHLGVRGSDDELFEASEAYGNHALALTLLGTYLVTFCEGDVRRRADIRELQVDETKPGRHAQRVMASYERMYRGEAELDILKALGYFDRPAELSALKLVLPKFHGRKFRAALWRLHEARLVLTADSDHALDCHPLVREHFAVHATPEGHALLSDHYTAQAPRWPESLKQMTPLFRAVYHGCQAGSHQTVLDVIYRERIQRGNRFFLIEEFGAFGADLALLANFFEERWSQPLESLAPREQAWLLGQAGSALRAMGRLGDAVTPLRTAALAFEKLGDWINASRSYANLSCVHLTLGEIPEGISEARRGVDPADRSGDMLQRMGNRTHLGNALHQAGDVAAATFAFQEAERIQVRRQPRFPVLYFIWGHQYCDLLVGQGKTEEVIRRASRTLPWSEEQGGLLDRGLDHLSLGRAYVAGSAEATQHLDKAIDFLRRAGQLDYLAHGLLARGTERDLDEAFRIASRSGMRLHLADYHLVKGDLAGAEKLINENGYHRRDRELEELGRNGKTWLR